MRCMQLITLALIGMSLEGIPAFCEDEVPNLALEGYCPVTAIDEQQWSTGHGNLQVRYHEQIYYFGDIRKRAAFLQRPAKYAPVLTGTDIVAAKAGKSGVTGQRRFGLIYHGRVYLFASRENLGRFYSSPDTYERYLKERESSKAMAVDSGRLRPASPSNGVDYRATDLATHVVLSPER